MLFPSVTVNGQTIIYVNDDASGANDGSSWEDAFVSLQDARTAAIVAGGISEIWVASGVYHPDTGLSESVGNRSSLFQLTNNIVLLGGFAGNEVIKDQRDWKIHESILSGDIGFEIIESDNSYHVISGSGTDVSAVLDGFIVESGFADGPDSESTGAGMYISNGSPTINNTVFRNNTSESVGGGIYISGESSPAINNCLFISNTTTEAKGGAIYDTGSGAEITNTVFEGNVADDQGGAIYIDDANTIVSGSIFTANKAETIKFDGSSPSGGAIYNNGGSPVVSNSSFLGNMTVEGNAGAVFNRRGNPTYINVIFSGNSAGINGGGSYDSDTEVVYINATWTGNTANNDGGGVFHNCFNCSTESSYINSIISGNAASGSQDDLHVQGSRNSLTISHSLLARALPANATDGGGNINGNAAFLDSDGLDDITGTTDDNVALLSGSLGIDLGSNEALDLNMNGNNTDDFPVDIEAFTRIYDSNGDGTAIVDIGALESRLPAPTNLTIESGDSQLGLTWRDLNAQSVVSYSIYRSTSPSPSQTVASILPSTESFLDSEVTNYVAYFYRIAAVDQDGIEGRFSAEVSAMPIDLTPPGIPSGFEAIAGDSLVSLLWNANEEGDLASYRIVRDTIANPTEQIAEVEVGQESFDDIGLTNNITYYYRIAAADTAGNVSDFSDVINATPIGTAFLQFVHNAPDVPDLQVSVSGEQIVSDLSYNSATDFIELRSVEVDLLVTYDPGDGSTETVLDSTIILVDEKAYVFVVNGLIGDDSFELVLNEDGRYKATDSESVDFFVFHGSPDAPTVEVNLLDSTPTHTKLAVLANNLSYSDYTTYRSVAADVYNIEIVSSLTGQQVDVYGLDVSELAGSSVTVVVGGYLQPENDDQPFGVFVYAGEVEAMIAPVVTNSEEESALPTELVVRGTYPNPFQNNAVLTFDLPKASEVNVDLFDMLGRKVFSTGKKQFSVGSNHSVSLEGGTLAAGIYVYKVLVEAEGVQEITTGRMVKVN